MIKIKIPKACIKEQHYIIDILLREYLGLDYEIRTDDIKFIEILATGFAKKLVVNADFFLKAEKNWLETRSMPVLPLELWNPLEDDLDLDLVEEGIPILFGKKGLIKHKNHWYLNVDIFGSSFFMLSRYEELIVRDRDSHNRFPADASIAYKVGFLDRPIVNEYLEILWSCLHSLWPSLKRAPRQYRKLISCDVDHPFDPIGYSLKKTVLRVGARIIRDRNITLAIQDTGNYFFKKIGSDYYDQYRNNIDWMMDVNNKVNNKVSFNFIPLQTSEHYEDANNIASEKMVSLLKSIIDKGHEVGFHPGYQIYNDTVNFSASAKALKKILESVGLNITELGGRQHYLRYDISITPRLWEENNFIYDSSLGYADKAGFRAGVCYEYSMYDLIHRKKIKLKQRPLVAMDCSIISKRYENLGFTDKALSRFKYFDSICNKFNGDFTLLWHNSFFSDRKSKHFYQQLIKHQNEK